MVDSSNIDDSLLARVGRLEDERDVRRAVIRMVGLVDQRDWEPLREVFTLVVYADWSRLTGEPASEISASSLVEGWERTLSGLDAVQHLLGNIVVDQDEPDRARASAYVHAAQRLGVDFASSLWVVAGSYDFELERYGAAWLISGATYRPAWGWGNRQIMAVAALPAE